MLYAYSGVRRERMPVTGVTSFVKPVCFIMEYMQYVPSSDTDCTVSTNERTQLSLNSQ